MTEEQRIRKNLKERIRYARSRGYQVPEDLYDYINKADYYQLLDLKQNWQSRVQYVNAIDVDTGEVYKLNKDQYQKLMEEDNGVYFPNGQRIAGLNVATQVLERFGKSQETINSILNELNMPVEYETKADNWLKNEKREAKDFIENIIYKLLELEGVENAGARLEPYAREITSEIEGINFASKQEDIDHAKTTLVEIIVGHRLSDEEYREIEQYVEEEM